MPRAMLCQYTNLWGPSMDFYSTFSAYTLETTLNYVINNVATCAKDKHVTSRLGYATPPTKGRSKPLYQHYSTPQLDWPASRNIVLSSDLYTFQLTTCHQTPLYKTMYEPSSNLVNRDWMRIPSATRVSWNCPVLQTVLRCPTSKHIWAIN